MIRIHPYPLWIGHGGEGHDFPQILDLGIGAVIELAVEEPSLATRRELIACRFPLIDGAGNRPELLALAVRTVASLIVAEVPTLVCCSEGMSRSPAVVAAALAVAFREPPEACLKRVAEHHPHDVSPRFWGDLIQVLPRVFDLSTASART
jgi:hypothetical protein